MKASSEPFEVGGQPVAPGTRRRFDLPAALLPTHTQVYLPLTVVHGREPGPRLWVNAALHGDELNGIEVIRRVLERVRDPMRRGTLLAVPIVNVFGFLQQSRYLPDRRDLNRSFPGSRRGSLASRIAYLFTQEIVARSTHGLDLHTGSQDRSNLPQVRGNLLDAETLRFAKAFGAPVMLHSVVRNGSLRATGTKLGLPVLVYEGGQSQRFNDDVIEIGVRGVLGVMRQLGMLAGKGRATSTSAAETGLGRQAGSRFSRFANVRIDDSSWVRARRGGLLRLSVREGDLVQVRQELGSIADPLGDDREPVVSPFRGLVIGKTLNPVVHGGDAVVHVGKLDA